MPKGHAASPDVQTVDLVGSPGPLECATCGRLFDGDPDEDPEGENGLPMCGFCNRSRTFDVELDELSEDDNEW